MEPLAQEQTPSPTNGKDLRAVLRYLGGRDELNLAEFPITLLADRVPKGLKTLAYEDRVFDQQSGEMVTRKLTITGSDRYGLPTAVDDEVLVALLQITKVASNFTQRDVRFTRYEVLKLLGWSDDGVNYRRVEESVKRWMGVTLYYDKAWWNKDAQAWVSEQFHILDNVSIVEPSVRRRMKARGRQELPLSILTWNRVVFESFQADNLKRLDIDTYFRLSSSVAKRMFRFLDKRFFHRRRWEFDLREFAFEHIGLSRGYADAGKLKEKLQPAIDELTDIGFLEPMSREDRYVKLAQGVWKVVFLKGERPTLTAIEPTAEPDEGERELTSRGVSQAVAAELLSAHDPEFIKLKVEVFDWLIARKDKRVSKSPGGYLASSIRKGYAIPQGFESKAERERKLADERERTRRTEEGKEQAAAKERAEEEAQKARVASYLASLTPEAMGKLEEEAVAEAPTFYFQSLRRTKGNPEVHARYREMVISQHVLDILDARKGR